MTAQALLPAVVHQIPRDLKVALTASPEAVDRWNSLTPLARNEWVCWVVSVKLAKTRRSHVERTIQELIDGARRPCCWIGCIHRTDKKVSPSVEAILRKDKINR